MSKNVVLPLETAKALLERMEKALSFFGTTEVVLMRQAVQAASTDYSTAPRSIAEARADKASDAALWTPRDALLSALRDYDTKDKKPAVIFIATGRIEQDEKTGHVDTFTNFYAAGRTHYEVAGVTHRALYMLNAEE